jgi:hypothetical protein
LISNFNQKAGGMSEVKKLVGDVMSAERQEVADASTSAVSAASGKVRISAQHPIKLDAGIDDTGKNGRPVDLVAMIMQARSQALDSKQELAANKEKPETSRRVQLKSDAGIVSDKTESSTIEHDRLTQVRLLPCTHHGDFSVLRIQPVESIVGEQEDTEASQYLENT